MSVALHDCVQYGALPWRVRGGALEVLLITTLNTKRWIVPKGWPIDGLAPCECAAMEALEEAGVAGEIATEPLGSFAYLKQRKHRAPLPLRIEVFALEVRQYRRTWAERAAREACWCSVPDALGRIDNAGLRRLIARFAASPERRSDLVAMAR